MLSHILELIFYLDSSYSFSFQLKILSAAAVSRISKLLFKTNYFVSSLTGRLLKFLQIVNQPKAFATFTESTLDMAAVNAMFVTFAVLTAGIVLGIIIFRIIFFFCGRRVAVIDHDITQCEIRSPYRTSTCLSVETNRLLSQ